MNRFLKCTNKPLMIQMNPGPCLGHFGQNKEIATHGGAEESDFVSLEAPIVNDNSLPFSNGGWVAKIDSLKRIPILVVGGS